MKGLVDINVLLDVILEREPWADAAVRILEVIPIEKDDLHQALILPLEDFEDAVQAAAALKIGADHIITRNEKDFRGLPVSVVSPATALLLL